MKLKAKSVTTTLIAGALGIVGGMLAKEKTAKAAGTYSILVECNNWEYSWVGTVSCEITHHILPAQCTLVSSTYSENCT